MVRAGPQSRRDESSRRRTALGIRLGNRASLPAMWPGQVCPWQRPRESHLRSTRGQKASDSAPDSRRFQLRRAPRKLMHTPRSRHGCSTCRRGDGRLLRPPPQRRSAACRFSETALAIHAIGNAAQDILDHPSAYIGVKMIERFLTAKRTVGSPQPFGRFSLVADHLDCIGIHPRHADGPIGFRGSQQGLLTETPGQSSLRNAKFSRKDAVSDLEFVSQSRDGAGWQALTDKARQIVRLPDDPAQHFSPAQHLRDRRCLHNGLLANRSTPLG